MSVKEQVLEGALELFKKMGIRAVTMDMLAVHLGMSKRTIYENFKNKDEIVEACVRIENEKMKAMAQEILQRSEHYIETYIMFMWAHINRLRGVNPLFMHDLKRIYPKTISRQAGEFDHYMRDKMVEFIEKGKKDKLFRAEVNPQIVANVVFEFSKLLRNRFETGNNTLSSFPLAEVFEHMAINFIRGLSTVKGIERVEYYYNKHKSSI
ncbi:TetR/AcrR family transcriptional regulator [Tenuifilum thalassicum]|uniref:TetR/AcrR family transcriptional regulator n=1 Tax=Tenuifilum thalassicum TaxID=2590900 RepID=A0A7D3XYN0_9BACT|nr:TetR/AcrR family transcriptional regulator [Tenuifilum thalassicum]QKG79313.1 TetR/AcrR family transcriptional regulator [Tenuifilum thalassicum]